MTDGRRSPLDRLFSPRSVAIVGASERTPASRHILGNLLSLKYEGQVGAVNPNYREVLGTPCYPRLSELPFVPDAVVVTMGADRVLDAVEQCVALGVGGAVVPAMGFADAGPNGAAMQARLKAIATEGNLALIGPNCQGIINFEARCAMYLRAVQPYAAGSVAVISQSGSMTTSIVNSKLGLRFRYVASTGNEAVVTAATLIDHFARDPHVSTILVFAEAIREPSRFADACDLAAESGKAVVVLKAGRTDKAQAAAQSHSGAISSPDRLIDALLRRHHVIRVESLEELLTTGLVSDGRRPAGARVAAVTISGGQIALLHDHAAETSITFPPFGEATVKKLDLLLPSFLTPSNPLDVWGMEDLESKYVECLQAVAEDPAVDTAVAVAEQSQYPTGHAEAHLAYFDAARAVARRSPKTVVLLASVLGGLDAELVESLRSEGVLAISGFQTGLRSISNVARWQARRPTPGEVPDIDFAEVARALAALGGAASSGLPALRLLAAAGIPTVESIEVTTPDDAMRHARQLGYPVALKSADPWVLHKTEVGAVALALGQDSDVLTAAEALQRRHPGSLMLQPMVAAELELIIGTTSHTELGAFVLVGAGGIWVEVLDDVVVRPAPVSKEDAIEMVSELRIAPLLSGARGRSAYDVGPVANLISRLGLVAQRFEAEIEAIDVNPVMITHRSVLAVDALVIPRVSR